MRSAGFLHLNDLRGFRSALVTHTLSQLVFKCIVATVQVSKNPLSAPEPYWVEVMIAGATIMRATF